MAKVNGKKRCLVAGAGGFIGGHLVEDLLNKDFNVTAVDIKTSDEWYQIHPDADNWAICDLSHRGVAEFAVRDCNIVYNLAADMGGMGFIENNKALCMLSSLINTHLLIAAQNEECERYFYSSSACVYAADKQTDPVVVALVEADAYPAMPEDGYGWEKLFSERMCRHYREDFGLPTRVARFHNVYGPYGTFRGGREKAPAAICRKVIECVLSGEREIEIWGDGNQTRSFMWIGDCLEGIDMITNGTFLEPINLGSSELVTVNQLVTLVEDIAQIKLTRHYDLNAPQGVRGRNSDNTLIKETFNWEPSTPLADGMEQTYSWIFRQMKD